MSGKQGPKLNLVETIESDTIPFERRTQPRYSASGRVTAVQTEVDQDGRHNRICSLTLSDMSELGVGAYSQQKMALGSTITVFFPPHGPERGFDVYGKIVRCDKVEHGYEIGVQMVSQTMAA